jgi:hypothetical protein
MLDVTQLVSNLSSLYAPELTVGYTAAYCSDHQSFWELGFPVTPVFERAGPVRPILPPPSPSFYNIFVLRCLARRLRTQCTTTGATYRTRRDTTSSEYARSPTSRSRRYCTLRGTSFPGVARVSRDETGSRKDRYVCTRPRVARVRGTPAHGCHGVEAVAMATARS